MAGDWIFVVSGFTQRRAGEGNGSAELAAKLRRWSAPRRQVRLMEWNEDPVGWADYVADAAAGRIMVCAYSYGAGWWFRRFAARLAKHGHRIETAVLCDAVRRYPWYLFFLRWRALRRQTMRVPGNVRRVISFVQHVDEPGGDDLEVGPGTRWRGHRELAAGHGEMDNASEYHEAALKAAGLLFERKGRYADV